MSSDENHSEEIMQNLSDVSNLITKTGTHPQEQFFTLSPASYGSPKRQENPQIISSDKAHYFDELEQKLEKAYSSKLEELGARNTALNKENGSINRILSALKIQVDELVKENSYLSKLADERELQETELQREISKLRIQLSSNNNVKHSETKVEEVESLRQENNRLLDQNTRLLRQVESLQKQADEQRRLEKELEKANQSLCSTNNIKNKLEEALDEIRHEKSELENYLSEMDNKNKQLLQDINEISDQIESSESKIKQLEKMNETLKSDNVKYSGLDLEHKSLKSKFDSVQRQLDRKEHEVKEKEVKIEHLELEYSSVQDRANHLLEVNNEYEQSLRESQSDRENLEKNKESLRRRLQEIINEKEDIKRSENQLRIHIEELLIESKNKSNREEEMQHQLDEIHQELLDSEAKKQHIESLFNELTDNYSNLEQENNELRDENQYLANDFDAMVKIKKTFDFMWLEISNIAREVAVQHLREEDLGALELPEINIESFGDSQSMNIFISHISSFEGILKDIIGLVPSLENSLNDYSDKIEDLEDIIKEMREQIMNQDRLNQTPQYYSPYSQNPERYKNAYEQLRKAFHECMGIFEIKNKNLGELTQVVQEYCDSKIKMEEVEEEIKQKEAEIKYSSGPEEKDKTYREIKDAKAAIQDISKLLGNLERRQKTLINQVKKQAGHNHLTPQTPPLPPRKLDIPEEQAQSKRQNFFQVSEVDNEIAKIFEEGSNKVLNTIQRVRGDLRRRNNQPFN